MAFNIYFFTLAKRDNSTKQPQISDGVLYSCILKHESGILNPSISVNIGLTNNPSQYNYAYIPEFGRYYFISEWLFEDSLWTAFLKVDVLATYKNEIGESNLYIMRAAAASNGNITDVLYPAKTGCNFASDTKPNPWSSVSYVIGVVNRFASFGSLNYFVVDATTLAGIATFLMEPTNIINTTNGFDLADASQALQLSLVDPIQYIKTCMMIPVSASDYTDLAGDTQIYCFNWGTGKYGSVVRPVTRIYKNYSFTIPQHPDTASRGNYVNSAPFTNLTLTIPPFGCIDVDTSVSCNASTVDVHVEVDPISGKGVLVVKCNGIILNRLESQIGVPISLSQVTRDYVGAVAASAGAIGGAVSGFASAGAGGAVLGLASGIGNAIEAMVPRSQTVGSTGSFVSNRGEFRLDAQFFRPINDDNVHNGRPLCEVRKINTLSGYMIIQDGDVTINGTASEDSLIRNYLEGGFYYE